MANLCFTSRQMTSAEVAADILQERGANVMLHSAIVYSDVEISLDLLHKAMHTLSLYQPMLRKRIAFETNNRDGKPKLARRLVDCNEDTFLDAIQIITGRSKMEWVHQAEGELFRPFNAEEGPLWKLIYVDFIKSESNGIVSESSMKRSRVGRFIRRDNGMSDSIHRHGSRHTKVDHAMNRQSRISTKSFDSAKTFLSLSSVETKYEGAILFKAHHVIADGLSVLSLISEQLIPMIRDLSLGVINPDFTSPLPMTPSAESCFINGNKIPKKLRKLAKQETKFVSSSLKDFALSPIWTANIQTEDQKLRPPTHIHTTKILPFTLGSRLSQALSNICSEKKVSVFDTVLTASVYALGILSKVNNIKLNSDHILVGYPINLRQFHSVSFGHEPLGMWLGYGTVKTKIHTTPPGPDKFWHEVKQVDKQVRACLKHEPWESLHLYDEYIEMLTNSKPNTQALPDFFKVHMEVSTVIANSKQELNHVYSIEQSASISASPVVAIKDYYSMKSMSNACSVPLSVNVTVFKGQLNWNIVYNSRHISKEFALDYVDLINGILKAVANPDTGTGSSATDMTHLPPFLRAKLNAVL